jgi:N-acetyl-anhydromuramyl-L-alanine amidase AmpD
VHGSWSRFPPRALSLISTLTVLAAARPAAARNAILVAGQEFDVGRPVVLWSDPEGFDGYATRCLEADAIRASPCCRSQFFRFRPRRGLGERSLAALQTVVRQVVLHFDGCVNSRSCFYSMHDMPRPDGGCGLSAHFMVDSDGIIYQTLDLLESAQHAEQANSLSIGIEICNRGDASRNELDRLPPDYRTRPVKDVVVNGHSFHAYDFRPEQYSSVLALVRVLVRLFPQVKPIYPERDGKPLLETLRDPGAFAGIVGHLHVDRERRKWDPGAFDWESLKRALHGYYFPVSVRGYSEVPDDAEELQRATRAFFRNAEERASGFFPVGPSGLWHSGIHLRAVPGDPVHAPARGRLLAARLGEHERSSTAMLLMRHDVDVAGSPVSFYSLLAHLGPQKFSSQSEIPWIRDLVRGGDREALSSLFKGQVTLLDVPVEAGDVVGSVGWVRRGPEWGPEIHFEIFTVERPPPVLARSFRFTNAAADGLLVARGAVITPIDDNGDRRLTSDELRHFFREGDLTERQALRVTAFRHVHEWGDRLSDPEEAAGLLRGARARERVRQLHARTTAPYVFWTARLAVHAGLPANQTIFSFHPITFLAALSDAGQGRSLPARASSTVTAEDIAPALPSLEDWQPSREVAEESQPIFGPLVGSEPRIRRKADIELIKLNVLP